MGLVVGLVVLDLALGVWYLGWGRHRPATELSEQAVGETVEAPADQDAVDGAALIRDENAKVGNPEWQIPDGDRRDRPIEGFTDRVSGQQGESVRLLVTTGAASYEVVAYRLGHYNGAGAREIWRSGPLDGFVQPDCTVHADTRMVDCSNWVPSLTVAIDEAWVPGQYLFKLVLADDSDSFVPFVVRDDESHSDVLIVSGVTTLQAYNTWGGYSLYRSTEGNPGGRATVVSFDRPFEGTWAGSGIIGDTYNVGMLAESQGLDVSYTTNVDQHERPELLANHRVIVTGAHDEYYSVEMRDGMESARDAGTNIAFLGANSVYRRIRFEPSPLGPSRHQVNYRTAADDPVAASDPTRATTSWRDPPSARPESTLTGAAYECNEGGLTADMVILDGDAWMFSGAGVTDGQVWPGMVREEYDRVVPGLPVPDGLQVVARSPLTCRGQATHSDMTWYTVPGGGGVFNAGTLQFEAKVGPVCAPTDVGPHNPQCQLRHMVANLLTELSTGPASQSHPSVPTPNP